MNQTTESEGKRVSTAANILVVDDEPSMQGYLRALLELDSYRVETFANGHDTLERVQRGPRPDLVLLDLLMPDLDGLQTLERLHRLRPDLKVIMLSCSSETRNIVQAIRLGALDYLTKPFQKEELKHTLQRCLGRVAEEPEPPAEADMIEEVGGGLFFVAASPEMRRVRQQLAQLADVDVPVLIVGESGTGKEVAARLLHRLSRRARKVFLKVNCAAVPADLLESELFGYEAGAFTGATRSKPGRFELCDGGTLLLDEVAEMPVSLQAKLLHVLQDNEFSRLGSRSTVRVNMRVLAATNVNVAEALQAGKLREDLYYRLNAFTIYLRPLRERKEEIPLLLKHFMTQLGDRYARSPLPLSAALVERCLAYDWPGNLRELGNFVKRYLILGDEKLVVSELRAEPQEPFGWTAPVEATAAAGGPLKSLVRNLKGEAEMKAIERALEQTGGNRKQAARLLQISYKALLYKIRQYGLGT